MTTRPTTSFDAGAVVLVSVVFTDGSGAKRRPAIVVTDQEYQQARGDLVIVPVTSQLSTQYGDTEIEDWAAAGLLRASLAKGALQTVHERNVARRLGALSPVDFGRLREQLRRLLGL